MKPFKIHKSTKKELAAMVKELPAIPFLAPDKVTGEPVVQMIYKTIKVTGAQLLKRNPLDKDAKDGEIIPTQIYLQKTETMMTQDHHIGIKKAYRKYGMEGAQEYCKQVQDYYYSLKTLPEAPKELDLGEELPAGQTLEL